MKQSHKIAVYSGEIPSTTFIERLITGLSDKGQHVMLFGIKKKTVKYSKRISVVGYRNSRFSKALHLMKYSLLLVLFKNNDKRILDGLLQAQSRNTLNDKVKSYPVLWYKPDIFHLQWAKGIADWIWVQEFGMKLVLSLRGAHINYSPIANQKLALMYKQTFPKVDGFHAVSKAIAKEAQMYGATPEKIQVIYSGLSTHKIIDSSKTNPIFQIISVGRPHWIKGYNYAIDACKILKEKNLSFQYTIVGGNTNLELLYQIKDLNLENNVKLTDSLSFEAVQDIMKKADLVFLPSLKEGVANVILEAMLQETLVLTTDCGGMDEVVVNDYNGFLIPIRNSKLMADTIIKIMQLSSQEKLHFVKNAFQTVESQHSINQMIIGMIDLYDDLKTDKKQT